MRTTAPCSRVAALVALMPLMLPSPFYFRIAALVFIFALAVLGLNLLMGFAGQVSLGHAGFFGIGAYAVAVAPTHWGVPSWAALIGGAAAAGALAYVVGRPILQLRGHYLAVATLGMGLLIAMVFTNEARLTGGPDGMPVPRLDLFGWRVRGSVTWYWVSGVTLVVGAWLATNLIASPTGRAFRAIHDSETAASVLGIDLARYKLTAFVLSAVYAAVAGSYLALFDGLVTPATAGFLRSIEFVTMAVLGGLGSILGSIVGAALLTVLPQVLTVFHDYEHIVLGLIMIVFMIFLRAGIVPSLATILSGGRDDRDRVRASWRRWLRLPSPCERSRAVGRGRGWGALSLYRILPPPGPPRSLCPDGAQRRSGCSDHPPHRFAGGGIMTVLAVHDVGIEFGGLTALDGVSLAVERGEIFAIIGPNGAGKTTLFNIVSGLYRPKRGRIVLGGEDVTGEPPHRLAAKGLSRTFQNLQVFMRMTAAENVMVGPAPA